MEQSLEDLVDLYDKWCRHVEQLQATISEQVTEANGMIKDLEAALLAALPPGVESMKFTSKLDGATLSLGPSTTVQYIPQPGHADEFWAWVQANNRFDLMTKAVKKSGIEAEIKATGKFPPFIDTMSTTKLSVTRKRAAP